MLEHRRPIRRPLYPRQSPPIPQLPLPVTEHIPNPEPLPDSQRDQQGRQCQQSATSHHSSPPHVPERMHRVHPPHCMMSWGRPSQRRGSTRFWSKSDFDNPGGFFDLGHSTLGERRGLVSRLRVAVTVNRG
ncbi:hypothetical protein T484DRAFT_1980607 [Baffinella frigidus]|nr:hypothetical protein T484DRAFT_1980607 [Cryptophyta sp. CCMP2293]